jgi:hypothetical protein
MKKLVASSLLVMGMAFTAMAAEYSGYIVDANCATKQGAKAASDGHAGCAAKCIKGGAAAVLMDADGKVYKIADQDKVKDHAGHKVTISGTLDGDTLKVDSVKM